MMIFFYTLTYLVNIIYRYKLYYCITQQQMIIKNSYTQHTAVHYLRIRIIILSTLQGTI